MRLFDLLATGLFSYLLHSTVLLGLALGCERAGLLRKLAPAVQETVWRWALFGGLLSAALAVTGELRPAAQTIEQPAPPALTAPAAEAPPPAPLIEDKPAPAEAPSHRFPGTLSLQRAAGPLTALWLLGAGSGLALLALQWLWLRRLTRRMPASTDDALQAATRRSAARLGLAQAPRLRVGERWASPLVAPGGEICLPLWTASLSAAQRDAIVAHELMHLRRRDPAWRLAGIALARLAWPQPLNRLALRRLDTLAELACDAGAARLSGSGRALAESLYVCAEQQQAQKSCRRLAPAFSAAMGGRTSSLLLRMHHLLENKTMSDDTADKPRASRRIRWLLAGTALMLLGAVLLPAVLVRNADALGGAGSFLSGFSELVNRHGNITRIESNSPDGRLRITLHGAVTFNEAEDDVLAVQGLLEVSDKRGGHVRELLIKTDESGSQRSYLRDGAAVASMNADDRQWLAGIIATLADATRSPAQRVERLLARGGVDAVFGAIDKQGSEHLRRGLLQALLDRGPADAATLDRALQVAERLNSAFERRSALETLATTQTLSDAQQQAYLRIAASSGSDFEAREALGSLAPRLSSQTEVMSAWVAAVRRIDSDFEARTALEELLRREGLSATQLDAALAASTHIDSDFEHRSALEAIARRIDARQPAQITAYADSAARIGSGFERREALLALVAAQPLDKAGYLGVLKAAERMDSNFELLQVLTAVAAKMPADAELIARYRQLTRGLDDHERGQAEKALDRLAV